MFPQIRSFELLLVTLLSSFIVSLLFSFQGSCTSLREAPEVHSVNFPLNPRLRLLSGKSSSVNFLVGSSGLEPPTSRLSGVRSNHLSYEPIFVAVCRCFSPLRPTFSQPSSRLHAPSAAGGDEQTRTVDPLLARQVLSHLSYTPIYAGSLSTSLKTPVPFSRNRWNRSRGPSSRGLQN